MYYKYKLSLSLNTRLRSLSIYLLPSFGLTSITFCHTQQRWKTLSKASSFQMQWETKQAHVTRKFQPQETNSKDLKLLKCEEFHLCEQIKWKIKMTRGLREKQRERGETGETWIWKVMLTVLPFQRQVGARPFKTVVVRLHPPPCSNVNIIPSALITWQEDRDHTLTRKHWFLYKSTNENCVVWDIYRSS